MLHDFCDSPVGCVSRAERKIKVSILVKSLSQRGEGGERGESKRRGKRVELFKQKEEKKKRKKNRQRLGFKETIQEGIRNQS